MAEIRAEFVKHRATTLRQKQEPAPAPTPQSLADLGRQYGREIAEQQLTIRADLYEAAVANPKDFWRGAAKKFSEPGQFTYFDKLTADGDLDRVVGYIIRKRSEDRIADLKRMIDTGAMGEVLDLAEDRSPGLERKAKIALAITLARAEIAALQNAVSGDLEGQQAASGVNRSTASLPALSTALAAISLDTLFDRWKAKTKPTASTLSTWRGIFKSLKSAFPDKAEDVQSITSEDFVQWKDDLVESGKIAKTINDSYLACIRTVLNYDVNNRLLTANPAIGVKVSGGKRGSKASKTRVGYTNAGVVRLLELAKKETKSHLRWVSWLTAATGSRVSEIVQLWGIFVKEEDGIHFLDIKRAPDGGSLKEVFSERTVPLHPQLIKDGFLELVKSRGGGPLFYGKSSGDLDKKHASVGVASRVREWVRANGFTDKRIDPNHGLRHWFKTHADDVGITDRMADRLQGRAAKTDAGGCYDPGTSTMLRALERIKLPPVKKADENDSAVADGEE